jgi:hypothetical protein
VSTSTSPNRARGLFPGLSSIPLPRPRLTVVPAIGRRTSRLPFVAVVIAVLGLGLVGLLLLNTSMERGAFTVTALRAESSALTLRQQALQLDVAGLQQPQSLAQRAVGLGMVPDPGPAFLDLGSGAVRGHSAAGVAGTQLAVGDTSVPTEHQLGKLVAALPWQLASGSMPLVTHPAVHPAHAGGPAARHHTGGPSGH